MRKIILTILSLAIILMFVICTSKTKPTLQGFYQSERVNGYYAQISIQQDNNSFVEFIENREVNKGTYEQIENNTYKMKGDKQNFEITLNDDNSFEIIIKKLNNGKPIKMTKHGNLPTYFFTEFDDVAEYRTLLD